MGYLIDSSILIDAERGTIDLRRRIAGREEQQFFVSVISASELLHGVHRANNVARRAKRSAFVEAMLSHLPLLPVDMHIARVHAQVWAELASRGITISVHDLWLGASAIACGLTMATVNLRDFTRIPGLKVESWAG